MNFRIAGKKAAIAAATGGLGFAAAKALAAEGVQVAICGRDTGRVERAAALIADNAVGIKADLASPEGASGFIRDAIAALGTVDILVCNAGGPPPGLPMSTTIAAYQYAVSLNLLSTIAMCEAAIPGMRERKWGRVVTITSHAVREPSKFIAASCTARAGVSAYLKVLSREVAADGVTVNAVQPGAHDTNRLRELGVNLADMAKGIPVGYIGNPEHFGQIVSFFCSDMTDFVTGTSVLVDGGAYPGLI